MMENTFWQLTIPSDEYSIDVDGTFYKGMSSNQKRALNLKRAVDFVIIVDDIISKVRKLW